MKLGQPLFFDANLLFSFSFYTDSVKLIVENLEKLCSGIVCKL